jgi:hypothetical protein
MRDIPPKVGVILQGFDRLPSGTWRKSKKIRPSQQRGWIVYRLELMAIVFWQLGDINKKLKNLKDLYTKSEVNYTITCHRFLKLHIKNS